jgi:hypothetical protein
VVTVATDRGNRTKRRNTEAIFWGVREIFGWIEGRGNTQGQSGRVVNPRPYHGGTQSSPAFSIDFQSMVIEPENG